MRIQTSSAYPVFQTKKAAPLAVADAEPQADQAPAQNQLSSQSVFSGIMDFCKKAWNAVVEFVKGVFGKKPDPALTPDEQAIVAAYNLMPSKENVQAFLNEAKSYELDGTLGPGTTDKEQTETLQQCLKDLGYAWIDVTGEYDDKTMEAVVAYKKANGLHQTYKGADGNWAINEYATQDMLQKVMSTLEGK